MRKFVKRAAAYASVILLGASMFGMASATAATESGSRICTTGWRVAVAGYQADDRDYLDIVISGKVYAHVTGTKSHTSISDRQSATWSAYSESLDTAATHSFCQGIVTR